MYISHGVAGGLVVSCILLGVGFAFLSFQINRRKLRLFHMSAFNHRSQDNIAPGSYCVLNELLVLQDTGQPLRALEGGEYDSKRLLQISHDHPSVVGFVAIRQGVSGRTHFIPIAHDQPMHPVLYASRACIPTSTFKDGGLHVTYIPVSVDTKPPRKLQL